MLAKAVSSVESLSDEITDFARTLCTDGKPDYSNTTLLDELLGVAEELDTKEEIALGIEFTADEVEAILDQLPPPRDPKTAEDDEERQQIKALEAARARLTELRQSLQ